MDTIAKSPHIGGERGIVPDWRAIELPAGWRYTTRLPDPYPTLACGDAETAHRAVGHRILLPTPLGTHAAPMREEAVHIQVELDFTGPRVQADNDRVPVALAGKDIDFALGIHVRVGATPPHGGVAFPQGDVPWHDTL